MSENLLELTHRKLFNLRIVRALHLFENTSRELLRLILGIDLSASREFVAFALRTRPHKQSVSDLTLCERKHNSNAKKGPPVMQGGYWDPRVGMYLHNLSLEFLFFSLMFEKLEHPVLLKISFSWWLSSCSWRIHASTTRLRSTTTGIRSSSASICSAATGLIPMSSRTFARLPSS